MAPLLSASFIHLFLTTLGVLLFTELTQIATHFHLGFILYLNKPVIHLFSLLVEAPHDGCGSEVSVKAALRYQSWSHSRLMAAATRWTCSAAQLPRFALVLLTLRPHVTWIREALTTFQGFFFYSRCQCSLSESKI